MTNHQHLPSRPNSTLLAYLQLFRLPNLFTAMADVAMGYLVVHGSLAPAPIFLGLLAASCLIYTAGMVLNDVYDLEVDTRQRPQRPLPSGRISAGWAKWLGYEMLLAGVAVGWLAGYIVTDATAMAWRGGVVATLLAVCVVLYDRVLKRIWIGPLAMGACRLLNVLLGMSIAPQSAATGGWQLLYYEPAQWLIAGGMGLYIVGVTWFARTEAIRGSRPQLAAATGVMMAGIVLLGLFPSVIGEAIHLRIFIGPWRLLLFLLAVTIARRCLTAVYDPIPQQVQVAVKQAILTLIVLDGSVCLAVGGPMWGIGVVALLLPTLLLGRWVYST